MSTELHTLSGAYAIDALSPEEAEAFRTHLAGCQACRDEVRELRQAAALMGASEALVPPAALKARVLAAADQVPQLPPLVPPGAAETAGPAGPGEPVETLAAERAKRRWAPRLLAAAAAVVLLVGGAIGIGQLSQDEAPPVTAAVSKVFDAPDAHTATVRLAKRGAVTVAVSRSLNEMAVDTGKLHAPGSGRVYQLWTMHDGHAVSAGLLTDVAAGAAMGIPEPGTQVAITVEPAGGSAEPTGPPIVTVDPASV